MNIELNKCYRTRDGRKARVICVDFRGVQSIIAIMENKKGSDDLILISRDGTYAINRNPCPEDLISEWVDKPEMDRSVLPPWIKAVAMDNNGCWFGYMREPHRNDSVWFTNSNVNNDHCYIPPSHAPKWSGDWRESLVVFDE